MRTCAGTLVVHRDGTPGCCTQDSSGPGCPERSYERHRSFAPYRVAGTCARCAPLSAPVADERGAPVPAVL